MPFAWGDAAAGAQGATRLQQQDDLALEKHLAEIAYRQQMMQAQQQQQAQAAQRMQLEREQFDFNKGRVTAQDQRQGMLDDRADTGYRQKENERGVQTKVGELIRREGITPQNRGQIVGTLVEAGRLPTAEDLRDPVDSEAKRRADLEDYEAKEQIQAKYRPKPQGAQSSPEWIRDAQGNIAKRVARAGDTPYSAGGSTLTGAQEDELATMDTVATLGARVLERGERIKWSGVGGFKKGTFAQFGAKNMGTGTKEEQSLRNDISNIKSTVAKLRGGTALTPQELALINTYTPTIDDDPQMIQAKIASLNEFITDKKKSLLRIAGGNYSGSAPVTQSGGGVTIKSITEIK